jgi:predicted RNA-binding Zn-ribbon protein involved in translation (DUF1610 family)
MAVRDAYENGECPDCGEPIPSRAPNGWECPNCGHVHYSLAYYRRVLLPQRYDGPFEEVAETAPKETAAHYACRECGATRGFQLVMKLGMDYNDVNKRAVMLAYPTIENWAPKDGDVRQYEVVDIIEGEGNCARAVFDPRKPRGKKAASNAPDPQDPTQDDPTDYSPEWWCPNCGEVTVDLDDLVQKVSGA